MCSQMNCFGYCVCFLHQFYIMFVNDKVIAVA